MGRARTGTIERDGLVVYARVTLADGRRPRVRLPDGIGDAEAAALVRRIAERVELDGYEIAPPRPKVLTWDTWTAPWFADRARRGMTSVPGDRSRWETWCKPLHAIDVRAIDRGHVEDLVRRLDVAVHDGRLSWKSASNVWSLARAMLSDMSASKSAATRVRVDNPSAGVLGPDVGERAARVYLYPVEVSRLLSCHLVPVRWRALYALAVYSYCRSGELAALRWGDVDLEAGIFRVQRARDKVTKGTKRTKGGLARSVPIEPALLPLLALLRGPDAAPVCHLESKGHGWRLRPHLEAAGVTRAALHTHGPSERPLTFHDLRATGLTWLALRGDDPLRIQRRAGHSTFATTQGYLREAEVLGSGVGDPFPPLPVALLKEVSSAVLAADEKKAKNPHRKRLVMGASNMGWPRKTQACETVPDAIPSRKRAGDPLAEVGGRLDRLAKAAPRLTLPAWGFEWGAGS